MIFSGDVVLVDFSGAVMTKRRPAIVVSSSIYHSSRPDAIVGIITSKTSAAKGPTDYLLKDWQNAGLRQASAFRAYFVTVEQSALRTIGHVSTQDWENIQACLTRAIALPS